MMSLGCGEDSCRSSGLSDLEYFVPQFDAAPNRTNAWMVWLATFISHDLNYTHDGLDVLDGPPEPYMNLHSSYLDLQVRQPC